MNEERILAFRNAFLSLPDEYKKREVIRLYNIVNETPVIILEDEDIGKVLKFLTVKDLVEYFYSKKQMKISPSYVYRVLKGEYSLMHGYKIYYEKERLK